MDTATSTSTATATATAVVPVGPLTGFTVVDASIHPQTVLATLTDGGTLTLNDPANGSYGFQVNTDSGVVVRSVRLQLSGAKSVDQTEGIPPYSLYGGQRRRSPKWPGAPGGRLHFEGHGLLGGERGGNLLGTLEVSFTVAAANTPSTTTPTASATATSIPADTAISTSTSTATSLPVDTATSTPTQVDSKAVGAVRLESNQPGVLVVSWDAPTDTPTDYRVNWARVGEDFPTWTDSSGNAFPTTSSYTITGLDQGVRYKVKVRARYDGPPGGWSGIVEVVVAFTCVYSYSHGDGDDGPSGYSHDHADSHGYVCASRHGHSTDTGCAYQSKSTACKWYSSLELGLSRQLVR